MSVKINYIKKKISKSSTNLILFSNDKFSTNFVKKDLSSSEFSYINDLLKTADIKKNLFVFEINSKKKIVLVSIKNNLKTPDIESLGAELYGRIKHEKNSEYFLNSDSITSKHKNFLGHFLHGLKLKSYENKKKGNKNY